MKLPSLNRPAKADPTKIYVVIQGWAGDPPGFPGFAPKIGDRFRGDHPVVKFLFDQGAGERLFIEDGATTDELNAATAAATFGALSAPAFDRPVLQTLEPLHLMISTRPITIAGQGLVPVGSVSSADSALVNRFADCFESLPDGYSAS